MKFLCFDTGFKYASIPDGHDHSPCNIYTRENMAIALSYLSVGFVMSFVSTPLNIYLVKGLNAEPQMQNTIGILQTLPWSMKLVFGFLSDAFPVHHLHRKPYLTMGALLYSCAFLGYSFVGKEDVVWLSLCIFLGTLGLIQMDVMADTMCVERSKFEPESTKGQMQSSYYSIRFGGGLLGAIAGGLVCNKDSIGWGLSFRQVSFINGMLPFILVVPWLFCLREKYKFVHPEHPHFHKLSAQDKAFSFQLVELNKINSNAVNQSVIAKGSPNLRKNIHNSNNNNDSKWSTKPIVASTVDDNSGLKSGHTSNSSSSSSLYNNSKKSLTPMNITQSNAIVNTSPLTSSYQRNNTNSSNNNSGKQYNSKYDLLNKSTPDSDVDSVEDLEAIGLIPGIDEDTTQTIAQQLQEIWETVQLQAVWRPMTFVYLFNIMQIPNVAWQSYLQLSLHFPAWILGLTVILGSFMTFAGTLAYKYYFFKSSWRNIYIWTVGLTTFFSLLQLCLIFQINQKYLHLSNYLFSMGDDVISAYINGIQFLPVCIMYMRLCPEGAEGASYSMLTTFGNIALVCSSNIGNLLANVWDVSNEAMERGDVSGLWKLSLLTSIMAVLPLSLLFLLPKSPEDQDQLAKSQTRSKLGGAIFLCVLFGSLLWTTLTAIYRINSV